MAGFDPKAYGFDSRTDVGIFLFIGGLAGIVDAIFDIAQSDPLTLGAMVGVTAVGAKKLVFRSDSGRDISGPGRDVPPPPPQ